MARYQKQRKVNYPMGSISSGTMREEDLIPTFVSELEYRLKHGPKVARETRKAHNRLVRDIGKRMNGSNDPLDAEDAEELSGNSYFDSEECHYDLESLFDALNEYAAPYFYFGSHPGNGADYGYWLSEEWDEDFVNVLHPACKKGMTAGLKVADSADIPPWFRGEVAVINNHGNVTLYLKTARALREIWSVV